MPAVDVDDVVLAFDPAQAIETVAGVFADFVRVRGGVSAEARVIIAVDRIGCEQIQAIDARIVCGEDLFA